MSQNVNVMLALQAPDGLAFGYVREASRTAMTFTVNANLQVGATMAWRMELKGYSETIMGRLTVTRAFPPASAGDWPRYDARVDEIPEEDLALLQVWMEDQEKGGSSRRMEKDPGRFVRDMFSEGMRCASAAQTKLVIDRMNERRLKREQMFKKKKAGIGGDFGLSAESRSTSSTASSEHARSRISAAFGDVGRRVAEAARPTERPAESPAPGGHAERPASLCGTPPPLPWAGVQPQEGATSYLADSIVAAALEAAELQSAAASCDALSTPEAPRSLDDEELLEDEDAPAALDALRPPDDEELLEDEDAPAALDALRPPDDEELLEDEDAPAALDALRPPDDEELLDDEECPAAPRAEALPALPAAAEEPLFSVDLAARPPVVRLRLTAATWGEQYQRYLRNNALFLAGVAVGARGLAVAVELTLPSGSQIRCAAQVVAALPSGTGLMLTLTRSDREQLTAEAG